MPPALGARTGLMPGSAHKLPNVDIAFWYQPATWVGGDYCDVWPLPDSDIFFAVGDVSGNGLPAATVMSNLHGLVRIVMPYAACAARWTQFGRRRPTGGFD